MRVHTVYNVANDLCAHEYTDIGASAKQKFKARTLSSSNLVNKSGTSREDSPQRFSSSEEIETWQKYYPGEVIGDFSSSKEY